MMLILLRPSNELNAMNPTVVLQGLALPGVHERQEV